MDELLRQAVSYLRAMWLYRWWGLAATWLVGMISGVVVFQMPDRYESSARIYVDTQSMLKPLMSGLAIQPNIDQQVAMLSRTLISRPTVERLIQMADLDITVKTKEKREALIARLMATLKIQSTGRDNLYTLAYQDESPERAKRVVQSLMSIFIESGLGDKRKDTDAAKRFIEEQIKVYEAKLEESENRLKDFKLKNMELMGNAGGFIAKIGTVSEQIKQARLDLREATNSRDALRRQLVGEEAMGSQGSGHGASVVAVPEIDARIDAQNKTLDSLLQRYTDSHPDVVGVRRVIRALEAEKAKEIESRQSTVASDGSAAITSPMFQQIKMALAESEANVASLQARVDEYESRLQQLKNSARLVPELETELAQLNRDYDTYRRNYDSLVSRRESASMSADLESSSGVAEFRLIDPPSLPSKPAAPNRVVLMLGAAAAAIAAGLGVAFLVSQLRPTVLDGRMLREVSGLPVLGAVSMIPSPERQKRQRRWSFAFYSGIGAYVGLMGVAIVVVAVVKG
jgi:polysaccharide chain length determinant protein (PEP-CTERM system associated)